MSLNERWCRYLEENERFWGVCLEVARSKPYLCAEEVEAEARDLLNSSKCKTQGDLLKLSREPHVIIQTSLDTFLVLSAS